MKFSRIGIVADKHEDAQLAYKRLQEQYPELVPLKTSQKVRDIDAIIALGGDGFMLHTLHDTMRTGIPVYGMNRGTVGFLMNEYKENDLLKRLKKARITTIHPLRMVARKEDNEIYEALAINEVSLLRKTGQAAKIRMSIDGTVHMKEMVCDGVLVATPAGSSAYNFSVGGPILPIKSNLLALTPISPFRPRRWHGALLPEQSQVRFETLKAYKRPVNAVADFNEVEDVLTVDVSVEPKIDIHILFDPGHSLEERILREQFA